MSPNSFYLTMPTGQTPSTTSTTDRKVRPTVIVKIYQQRLRLPQRFRGAVPKALWYQSYGCYVLISPNGLPNLGRVEHSEVPERCICGLQERDDGPQERDDKILQYLMLWFDDIAPALQIPGPEAARMACRFMWNENLRYHIPRWFRSVYKEWLALGKCHFPEELGTSDAGAREAAFVTGEESVAKVEKEDAEVALDDGEKEKEPRLEYLIDRVVSR
ncbi:hypothetical protein F4808DRAFT_458896 [Astrocystis sublimbata]|nr:hypothetical protein F4808DRAFT_458896 [Astrocystis sublimbata]